MFAKSGGLSCLLSNPRQTGKEHIAKGASACVAPQGPRNHARNYAV